MSTRRQMKVNELTGSLSPATSLGKPDELIKYFDKKFEEQRLALSHCIKDVENKVMQRCSAIEAELTNIRKEFKTVHTEINNTNKRCELIEFELAQLKSTIGTLENEKVAADVLLLNVPNDIDADNAFDKMVCALKGDQFKALKVFRTRSTSTADKSVPIIVKLHSSSERIRLFRALAEYRKNLNRHYKLSDFGLSGNDKLLVHECLSSLNREIMRSALHFKGTKLLHSVFTMRGFVFVRVRPDDVAVKVTTIDALNKTVAVMNKSSSI